MEKSQGLALGAVLAAAFLFRPTGSGPAEPSEMGAPGKTEAASSTSVEAKSGPWIASCKYWASVRAADPGQSEGQPELHGSMTKDGQVNLHVHLSEAEKPESDCPSDPEGCWGFPESDGNAGRMNVTALIATVPDPVHTHLAMGFDRTVDAILEAASDNNYVSSYYWLPWKHRGDGMKFSESLSNGEVGHDPERERQPGLMILKPGDNGDPVKSFYNVIYLFLIAETPTQGIDGIQLQNVFFYETKLKSIVEKRGAHFSTGKSGRVAIIGPQYTGAAAGLRAGIEFASHSNMLKATEFEVVGATGSALPLAQLTSRGSPFPRIRYLSFGSNGGYSRRALRNRLDASGYVESLALLVEDNTASGSYVLGASKLDKGVQFIRFPREISLLRNAQVAAGQFSTNISPSGGQFSPFLHFSLKDYSAEDSIPQFSREHTPLSQESVLMAIGHQLRRSRAEFIGLGASNPLDQIFLSQFLHRACPDASLLFFGTDLLTVREVDSVPFIGSVTVNPYPLIGIRSAQRAYTDSTSLAYYNAVSYILWNNGLSNPTNDPTKHVILQGYHGILDPAEIFRPSLWATAIGRDGYYPLAVLSPCASDRKELLPTVDDKGKERDVPCQADPKAFSAIKPASSVVYPSLLWAFLLVLVCLLCGTHMLMLLAADYWSPFTRDLAIRDNDQHARRSTYVHVATAMLFSMVFAVAFPVLWLDRLVRVGVTAEYASMAALVLGLIAVGVTFWKTWDYIGWVRSRGDSTIPTTAVRHAYTRVRENAYFFLNLVAWTALIGIPCLWWYLCSAGSSVPSRLDSEPGQHPFFMGFSFCFRSIHPDSGVSPVVPILLLLFSWYVWGFYQTWRLRFSANGRPWLPKSLEDDPQSRLLFVSDDDLDRCASPRDGCLYRNITCLLITREVFNRFFKSRLAGRSLALNGGNCHDGGQLRLDLILAVVYAGALVWFACFTPMRSLDHFLWNTKYRSCPFEFLAGVLFFPLIGVSLTGWLRMILIWGALKQGLLERLESMPIRYAFSRLKVMGWMTMLRSGGLQEQRRDLARGLESLRQMLHMPDLEAEGSDRSRLDYANSSLLKEVAQLRLRINGNTEGGRPDGHDYQHVTRIEVGLAEACRELLSTTLIPYWRYERTGLVESDETAADETRQPQTSGLSASTPERILVAEEFLAIRYISLIRAVLANLRYLMLFVSASFVLAVWAWNSYPFQPRQLGDWSFTGLLLILGSGVIWVLAQMHRNAILSRITDTKANELGFDFYLRVVSFGALPVFTWLAYQFPDVGSFVSKFLEPVVPVIK